jgi:hypothetical protein
LRKSGFHQVRTMLRFVIEGDKIKDLEIIEIAGVTKLCAK